MTSLPPGLRFALEDAECILAGTPDTLESLFRQAPDAWTRHHEGGDSWSPLEILGHLAYGEKTDWIHRARRILEEGSADLAKPADPFAAQAESMKGKSTADLLAEFRSAREESLQQLRELRLRDADLEHEGQHPALGTLTLSQLLATWVVHDLGHIAQICRALSAQYREEVGPWGEYLPILHSRHRDAD